MNLALSNFAWDNQNSEEVFKVLKENGINQIECILTKIKSWDELTTEDIIEYKKLLDIHGITAYSIQSLFYGVECKITDVDAIVSHFKRIIDYATILGSKRLIFGSPGLRKQHDGWEQAVIDIFNQVDKLLEGTDIKVIIEPNARTYGGKFWYKIDEIISFIVKNNFYNIRTMIDTHNSELESNVPYMDAIFHYDNIEHIHVSEIGLANIKESEQHKRFSAILHNREYNKTITYEVLNNEGVLDSIKTFTKIYNENNL
jgi:sugar phosphate isomerase/epimerase